MVGHPLPQDVVMQKPEQDRAEVAVSGVQEPGRWPGSPETDDAGNVDKDPFTVNANQRDSNRHRGEGGGRKPVARRGGGSQISRGVFVVGSELKGILIAAGKASCCLDLMVGAPRGAPGDFCGERYVARGRILHDEEILLALKLSPGQSR